MPQPELFATFALLSVVPFVLILTTCFIKMSVVLGFLKRGLSLTQALPATVMTALSILLTAFVMMPVATETYEVAKPLLEKASSPPKADTTPKPTPPAPSLFADFSEDDLQALSKPLLTWIARHTDPTQHALLLEYANTSRSANTPALSTQHPIPLITAFVLTELQEAFLIGFLILLPFLILELLIALMLASLQMNALQPSTVSLPFKLLLFVLIDGWSLLTHGLLLNYTRAP